MIINLIFLLLMYLIESSLVRNSYESRREMPIVEPLGPEFSESILTHSDLFFYVDLKICNSVS